MLFKNKANKVTLEHIFTVPEEMGSHLDYYSNPYSTIKEIFIRHSNDHPFYPAHAPHLLAGIPAQEGIPAGYSELKQVADSGSWKVTEKADHLGECPQLKTSQAR